MPDPSSSGKLISIIIPSLNEEKLLPGLLKQFDESFRKKKGIELIISDGGSTDSTLEIADNYADKVIVHKEKIKQNISRGRNQGAKISLGDVLIFLNADVILKDPEYLLNEAANEIRNNGVTAIACPIKVFPEEEKPSDRIFHYVYNNYSAMLNRFFTGMGRGECHIISREKFFLAGGYNENIVAGEDYDLYVRLKRNGKVKFRRDLIVYESPRRYRKSGYARVLWDWAKNSVSVTLFNRSISKVWEEVR